MSKIDPRFESNLATIAKYAIGSSECPTAKRIKGGRGRIGMIGDHVIKFNTHNSERLRGPRATQEMRDSCNNLRNELYSISKSIGLTDKALKSIRSLLGIKKDGQIPAKATLLSRRDVVSVIKLIEKKKDVHIFSKIGDVQRLKSTDAAGKAIKTDFATVSQSTTDALPHPRQEIVVNDFFAQHPEFNDGNGGLNPVGNRLYSTAIMRFNRVGDNLGGNNRVDYLSNRKDNASSAANFVYSLHETVKNELLAKPNMNAFLQVNDRSGNEPSDRLVNLRKRFLPDYLAEGILQEERLSITKPDADLSEISKKLSESIPKDDDFLDWAKKESDLLEAKLEISVRFEEKMKTMLQIELPESIAEEMVHLLEGSVSTKMSNEKLNNAADEFVKIFEALHEVNKGDDEKTIQEFQYLLRKGVFNSKFMTCANDLVELFKTTGPEKEIPKKIEADTVKNFCDTVTGNILDHLDKNNNYVNEKEWEDGLSQEDKMKIVLIVTLLLPKTFGELEESLERLKLNKENSELVHQACRRVLEKEVMDIADADSKNNREARLAYYGKAVAEVLETIC